MFSLLKMNAIHIMLKKCKLKTKTQKSKNNVMQ